MLASHRLGAGEEPDAAGDDGAPSCSENGGTSVQAPAKSRPHRCGGASDMA